MIYYLRRPTWLTTLLIWWVVCALTIYSWAGEKMPWLIIHITTPLVLLTARYLGELVTSQVRNAWEKRIAWGAFALLGLWTVHTSWPVNFERPDTPKDILVYTQTAPDVKKVMEDIERLSSKPATLVTWVWSSRVVPGGLSPGTCVTSRTLNIPPT